MITLREVEERIERGDKPEAIREFLVNEIKDGVVTDFRITSVGLSR